MNTPAPPDLPTESARHTYLRAAALLIPSWVFGVFSALVFVPKLFFLAGKAEIDISRASWLVSAASALSYTLFWGFCYMPVLLSVLEMLLRRRPRLRSRWITVVVLLFNVTALTALGLVASTAMLSASLLEKKAHSEAARQS